MDDVVTLIGETWTTDSIGQKVSAETRTEIFVRVSSITRSEWSASAQRGLQPEIMFETPSVNYSGQRTLEYNNKRYGVYRTYRNANTDMTELYCEEKSGA